MPCNSKAQFLNASYMYIILTVVINCMCAMHTFGFVIIGVFRYFLNVVVECSDLLLMFSLFVTDKEFVCCVLDIVSVFAGKLVIDS